MARIIKRDGRTTDITPANGKHFSLEEMQSAVGGYVEMASIPNDDQHRKMLFDEEGRMKRLPRNGIASTIMGFEVVGDVMIASPSELS